eukprot:COSAG05_NODE_68_length_22188_cov_8.265019_8_plen_73_part_00
MPRPTRTRLLLLMALSVVSVRHRRLEALARGRQENTIFDAWTVKHSVDDVKYFAILRTVLENFFRRNSAATG